MTAAGGGRGQQDLPPVDEELAEVSDCVVRAISGSFSACSPGCLGSCQRGWVQRLLTGVLPIKSSSLGRGVASST
ncbi:hypothetical protein COCON_G00024010 [Conger conger]|uniref:Uncharacterized protein n=1 Tax=Conger conger TaxID=82655 RepID=A0A9Q1DXD6_CONCO|nr:hypothetical protein COCON_G00024010 [Conger conger]